MVFCFSVVSGNLEVHFVRPDSMSINDKINPFLDCVISNVARPFK